jgi:hypothetical protein
MYHIPAWRGVTATSLASGRAVYTWLSNFRGQQGPEGTDSMRLAEVSRG